MTKFLTSKCPSIPVGKYHLEPLLNIRQDNISSLLGPKPGVYICDCPEIEWYEYFGFKEKNKIGIVRKKRRMFRKMAKGSQWISPTNDVPRGKITKTWKNKNILHLGYNAFLPKRISQTIQTISMFNWLYKHKKEYDYCLVYNFYLPFYLAPLLIKFLFQKKLYIDYEDDYTLQRKNFLKNLLESLLRKTVDGAICINENMAKYFKGKKNIVFNGFADLEYIKSANFNLREEMTFLFSSRLDNIRGVDLVPDLINSIRRHLKNFKIFITGTGPLESLVKSWKYPEVKYLGFLDNKSYTEVIKRVDACLVFQKPDHPFSKGSFPSKIDEYAEFKKPIFILKK